MKICAYILSQHLKNQKRSKLLASLRKSEDLAILSPHPTDTHLEPSSSLLLRQVGVGSSPQAPHAPAVQVWAWPTPTPFSPGFVSPTLFLSPISPLHVPSLKQWFHGLDENQEWWEGVLNWSYFLLPGPTWLANCISKLQHNLHVSPPPKIQIG